MRRRRFALLALLPLVAAASCSPPDKGRYMRVSYDDTFTAKLRDASGSGRTVALSSLTDFSWDAVYSYYEGTPADRINSAVGTPVLEPGTYVRDEGIAVFTQGGVPVKVLALPPLVFDANTKLTADVTVHNGRLVEPPR